MSRKLIVFEQLREACPELSADNLFTIMLKSSTMQQETSLDKIKIVPQTHFIY